MAWVALSAERERRTENVSHMLLRLKTQASISGITWLFDVTFNLEVKSKRHFHRYDFRRNLFTDYDFTFFIL